VKSVHVGAVAITGYSGCGPHCVKHAPVTVSAMVPLAQLDAGAFGISGGRGGGGIAAVAVTIGAGETGASTARGSRSAQAATTTASVRNTVTRDTSMNV
jgi:hypothetical protein